MSTAMITGATAGLGAEFARQLAAQGWDLVIVARDRTRLTEAARSLNLAHRVKVDVLAADLGDRTQLLAVEQRLRDDHQPIEMLVNNAGFGVNQLFDGGDVEAEQAMIDVLVTATMRLTNAAIPGMTARGRGDVITVSSVAGWIAGGTYSAAKAWQTTFSESLARQLVGTGVHVTAVCPGFTHTEFHRRAGMDVAHIPQWMWLDASDVVADALTAVRRGRALSVSGAQYKTLSLLARYLPRPLVRKVSGVRGPDRVERPSIT